MPSVALSRTSLPAVRPRQQQWQRFPSSTPPLNQSAAQTLGLRATHLIGGLGVVALVKPAERPSTAVHRWRECLNSNSSEIRPQALSCEALRRVVKLLQLTASADSRDDESFPNRWSRLVHQEPKDRCTKQGHCRHTQKRCSVAKT